MLRLLSRPQALPAQPVPQRLLLRLPVLLQQLPARQQMLPQQQMRQLNRSHLLLVSLPQLITPKLRLKLQMLLQ
jgi:hypothetical protein